MARFVVLSDLHAHPWSAFAKGDGIQNSRLQRSLKILDASLAKAQEDGIPWLFAGDLVHTAGYSLNVVMAGVSRVLGRYPDVVKLAVWGNHDARGVGSAITLEQTVYPALIEATKNMIVLEPWMNYEHEGLTIAGAGYQPRADLLDLGPGGDIGIFHQTVRGSTSPTGFELNEGIEASAILSSYRVALVGHVHHPQQFDCPKGQALLVPGSPEHHNFGDRGDHGWWILEVPKGKKTNPKVEFIAGGSPQFITVDNPTEIKDDGNFYRTKVVFDKAALPEHATFIAPAPTTVEQRGILNGVAEAEQILQAWLSVAPPDEPDDLQHSNDCGVLMGVGCDCPAQNEWDLGSYLSVGRQLLEAQDPVRLRPMRALRIRLENFCSYEDQEFEIQDGLWLVIGKGRDFDSNGAGKTTLVGEALYWLIFGRNTKGLAADEVIRWGASSCQVSAVLADEDGTVVEVTRGRSTNKPFLSVVEDGEAWEAASTDELSSKLTRYLGLTPEIYQNLGYFSQEKLLLFASATDGERKSVLADLIGLSAYNEASTAAGASSADFQRKREQAEAFKTVRQEQLAEHRAELDLTERRIAEWEEQKASRLAALKTALHALESDPRVRTAAGRLEKVMNRASRLEHEASLRIAARRDPIAKELHGKMALGIRLEMERLTTAQGVLKLRSEFERFGGWERAQQFVASLDTTRAAHAEARAVLEKAQREEMEARRKLAEVQQFQRTAIQQLADLTFEREQAVELLGQGICPTCRQAISQEHLSLCLQPLDLKLETSKRVRTDAARDVERSVQEVNETSRVAQEAKDSVDKVHGFVGALEAVAQFLKQIAELENQFTMYEAQLSGLEEVARQQADGQVRALLKQYHERKQRQTSRAHWYVQNLLAEHSKAVKRAEQDLKREREVRNPYLATKDELHQKLGTTEAKLAELDSSIKDSALLVAIYTYWKKGFSKQGIQSLLMEEIAALFNKNRGEIFPVLTQGVYDVQFSTISRTRANEAREKTEFLVFQHGEQIPYGALSGGQRRRVDIGIMLVMAQSVAEWMGVPGILGVLVLDEVFGFLDASGAEGLLEALQQVQKQIPTIFAVTHDSALQSMFPQVVRVQQDERGISTVN